LRRRGFSPAEIGLVRRAYKLLYRSGLQLEPAITEIQKQAGNFPALQILVDFLRAPSARGIVR
jgi:UDP-N-acetylglucosamine acyltransferase